MSTGRFAPTPSGSLHLGNLRTAMLAWCFARHDGGRFLVRVEDLTTGAAPVRRAEQLDDLELLGIDHDGDIVDQSSRTERYDEVVSSLEARGLTYPCFCSRRDIRDAAAAPHGPSIEGGYPGTCAALGEERLAELVAAGRPAATRVRTGSVHVEFVDELKGPFRLGVDDFVVRRADGVAAYNLAVVVDDADQGVDQVVRGDDLVHTTPRQVALARLLGLPTPTYVHVPLVYGADGERLAKRHGAISLRQRLERGDRIGSIVALLASSVGCADPDEELLMSEVLDRFDPTTLELTDWRLPE